MAGIPGVKPAQWWEKKWIVELISSFLPNAGSFVAASIILLDAITNSSLTRDAHRTRYWLSGFLFIMVVVSIFGAWLRIKQGRVQDHEQNNKFDHDGLVGALNVIYNLIKVKAKYGKLESGQFRITVHRVVPTTELEDDPEWLEMIVPYCGGLGKPIGNRSSIRSGIVGKVVREKEPHTAKRPNQDYEQYVKELKSKWSYTDKAARRLSSDRMSWMAVPIKSKGDEVIAVIYLDSNDADFFTDEVQDLIMSASGGVATYIQEKYR